MFCSKCGTQISDGAKFCPKCGTGAPQNQAQGNTITASPQPAAPVPPPAGQTQTAAPAGEKKKSKTGLYFGIGCLVILLIVIGLSVWGFIYLKDKVQEEIKNNPELNQIKDTIDSAKDGSLNQGVSGSEPKQTVASYMQNTLGTIPGAIIDYETAKTYLTPTYKKKFQTPVFVPQSYCIQNGPDDVKIDSSNISGDEAVVRVSSMYGSTWTEMWDFTLKKDKNGNWLISKIDCLAVS